MYFEKQERKIINAGKELQFFHVCKLLQGF